MKMMLALDTTGIETWTWNMTTTEAYSMPIPLGATTYGHVTQKTLIVQFREGVVERFAVSIPAPAPSPPVRPDPPHKPNMLDFTSRKR